MSNVQRPMLSGCDVLPPLEPARPARRRSEPTKGSPGTADRFRILNGFIDFTLGELRRNEICVWLVLYRDTRGCVASTSQLDIARRAGVSDRTVRRAILRLKQRGLLTVIHKGRIGQGPSSYRVHPLVEGQATMRT